MRNVSVVGAFALLLSRILCYGVEGVQSEAFFEHERNPFYE